MKAIFALIFLLCISCTKSAKNEEQTKTDEVSVKVTSTPILEGTKIESIYEIIDGGCRIAWQTLAEKEKPKVQISNRSKCDLAFDRAAGLHAKVLDRLLKDYPANAIGSIHTGGLNFLQPDGSWNSPVAKAAAESADYQDYRRKYPKHSTGKSVNQIFLELMKQTRAHQPFRELLAQRQLFFDVEHVEKVFQFKNDKGETVIHDAAIFWWRAENNGGNK